MRITHVETHRVRIPAPSPAFAWRAGLEGSPGDDEGAVLHLRTDHGVEGVALLKRPGSAPQLEHAVDRLFRDELVGQDPLDREHLWHRVWEIDRIHELSLPLLGIVDVALWDLAARSANLPVWRLLGGARRKIPAYASTTTFASIEEYLDVADQCLELGYTALKLHAWGDARRDARLCEALRSHVGDDVPLMYDGSAGFDLPDAIHIGRVMSANGYLWFEEPMREFSIHAYRQLQRVVDVPLLVAETSDGAHMNTADFIAAGTATFGVRTDTVLKGGITGSMRIAHLADAFRLRVEVHGSDAPNRHLCMAIPNTTYYESLVTNAAVERERHVDAEGFVHAPESVGIGLPADLEYPAELAQFVGA
ncbi:racemase [Microbacterium sp. NEAU-LLC]|uniref:Racemase n=1 Tax=Microbacterium helvum TaxID=2773713 RepID=A0ABR8NSK3_9MICO|nr:enolase C-terminal domain-like protein [Microbacterium helvum]MBD3943605.1 racemase [Microbacterium helvum]